MQASRKNTIEKIERIDIHCDAEIRNPSEMLEKLYILSFLGEIKE